LLVVIKYFYKFYRYRRKTGMRHFVAPGIGLHLNRVLHTKTTPAKAGGFGLLLKAGSIGHSAD
jgi:hypothetical protein